MLHCSGTASSVPFQQLGCCGKPAGESHQPQECGELLETVRGEGCDVDPCPGNGGQLPSALGSCQCTGLPTPGLGVRCLLTPQDRQKAGWQQTKALSPHGLGCFSPPTMSKTGCLDKEPAPARVCFVSAGSLGKQVMWEHIFDSILWPKYYFSLPVMQESHRADFLTDTQELHNSGTR